MAGTVKSPEGVWALLERHQENAKNAILKSTGVQGVTSFVKVSKGKLTTHINASCHYEARYKGPYDGLFTTTYIGTGFPLSLVSDSTTSTYFRKVFKTKESVCSWWAEFLMSLIESEDSYYHSLKDYVRLVYDDENRPILWAINGHAPHIAMTSFLVSTRKVKETCDPLYVHRLLELYPDLSPMEALSLALIVQCNTASSKKDFLEKEGAEQILKFYHKEVLCLWVSSAHTHCNTFHPLLHQYKKAQSRPTIEDITTSGTYIFLGNEWEKSKEHKTFHTWLYNYGSSGVTVEPLFHKVDKSSTSVKIPLDAFVKEFCSFVKEFNK